MRTISIIVLTLNIILTIQGQQLPPKILDQPDGLTISYFNSDADTCLPEIFIGNDLKILFPCYSKGDYQRIDISNAESEIKQLKKLLTKNFILNLNKCCSKKNCPDTAHGYFLMIKQGTNYYIQYIDIAYISNKNCGNHQLNEIIEILNKINKIYR